MDHGHPVETALAFPSGAMVASGGGPAIRLWDLTAGGQLVQGLGDAHSKTVTSLCLDKESSVLLSTSFDCLAKVFYVAGLQHIYTYRLPAPITCASWRPDDLSIALGLDNGQWQLRNRRTDQDRVAAQKRSQEQAKAARPKTGVVRRKATGNLRGLDREAGSDDEIVEPERPRKKKESNLDFYLRKFEYRKAAEILVQPTTHASEGFALVDELMNRGALQAALKDRDAGFCVQALKWLTKACRHSDPLQIRLFFEMLHVLLDNNRCLQPPSTPELVQALTHLDSQVAQEVCVQDALAETAGMLSAVMSL
jgi:U3 small nucleolar RNA-associated protein 15